MCFLKAAGAPGGLHEGPGWPRGGSRWAAWRSGNVGFSLFLKFFTFSMLLALLLMFLVRGGAGVLPKCVLCARRAP